MASPLTRHTEGENQLIAQLKLLECTSPHHKELRQKLLESSSLVDEMMRNFEGNAPNTLILLKDFKEQSSKESIETLEESNLRLKKLEAITTFVNDVEEVGSLSEAHKKADELKKRARLLNQAVKEVYSGIDQLQRIKETLQAVAELKKRNIAALTEV